MNGYLKDGAPLTKPEETPTVECYPHSIEVVDRPEGYREFRCTPSYWRYPAAQAVESFATESLGENRGVDKYGLGEAVEFWSGSDASLRMQAVPPHDLANRELVALASRRSDGRNAPGPWLSESLIDKIRERLMTEQPEERSRKADEQADADPGSLWDHYGMRESVAEPVIYSYGMSLCISNSQSGRHRELKQIAAMGLPSEVGELCVLDGLAGGESGWSFAL